MASTPRACSPADQSTITQAVQKCPFLRNIQKPTAFAFSPFQAPVAPTLLRGPIFEDGPSFDAMFRIFHGREGVVPLSEGGPAEVRCSHQPSEASSVMKYHPLAASAATISMSAFGGGGPFSFDSFMAKSNANKLKKKQPSDKKPSERTSNVSQPHEAMGSEWLSTGNCPIAKSYRAVSSVLPLVAKMLELPSGMKYKCPPAIVAARAALSRTKAVKALRPQALPTKVLAIGALGMAVNVPLGVWREHTEKFSTSWFLAVHASVPFIAMLRKAVIMPKYAMVFTIASAMLGQIIGSRAERIRLAAQKASLQHPLDGTIAMKGEAPLAAAVVGSEQEFSLKTAGTVFKQYKSGANSEGHEEDSRSNQAMYDRLSETFGMPPSENPDYESKSDTDGNLFGWGEDHNRAVVLNPRSCGQETWGVNGGVPPAGSVIY